MSESKFWSNSWRELKRESSAAIDFLFHRSPIEHIDALYNFFGDIFGTIILSIGILITYMVFRICYRRIGRLWFLKNKSKFKKFIFQNILQVSFYCLFILYYISFLFYYQLIIVIFILLAWLGKGIPVGGSALRRKSSTITGTHATDHMIFEDGETRRLVQKTKNTFR